MMRRLLFILYAMVTFAFMASTPLPSYRNAAHAAPPILSDDDTFPQARDDALTPSSGGDYGDAAAPATGDGGAAASTEDDEQDVLVGSPPAGELTTVDSSGQILKCSEIAEAEGGVLLGAIMPCLSYTIEQSTVKFTKEMVRVMRPLMYSFLALVVALFGLRLLQQEPNIEKQGMLLLLKISLVVTILSLLPNYIVPRVYDIMYESQSLIVDTLQNTSIRCDDVEDYGGAQVLPLWKNMDCVLGKLFGFTVTGTANSAGDHSPSMVLGASMFGLLSGFLFGGPWGVVVFFGMLGVLITLFLLVVRTAAAFLTGYLIICVMLIICPLLMPLIFMRVTQNYFEGVIKNIIAGFLMPVIIAAYAMFGLMVYDQMLFAPDSIIQKIFTYDEVKKALEASPRKLCERTVTGNLADMRTKQGETRGDPRDNPSFGSSFGKQSPLYNFLSPILSGAGDLCSKAEVPFFNMQNMRSADFKQGKATIKSIFYELVTLLILSYFIRKGLDDLPNIVVLLTGVGTSMPLHKLPGEERIEQSWNNMQQQMKSVGYDEKGKPRSGGDFVERAAFTGRDGLETFFKTMKSDGKKQ